MADWLSMNNDVASAWEMPKTCKILRNQTISHVASHAEMYYAYVVEVPIVACFLQFQDTAVEPMFIK